MSEQQKAPPAWKKATPSGPLTDQTGKTASAGAAVVQHHFVRAQLNHINTHGKDRLITETLAMLRREAPGFQNAPDAKVMKAFQHMTDRLQKANLTINFQAEAWFSTPNNYESYTQMYERAIRTFGEGPTGKLAHMVLKGDKLNPATTRANADDRATFGAHFLNADGTFKPEVGGIGRMMSPGSLVQSGSNLEGKAEYVASNPAFNPKSKQVFAALDYGRRPHGSSTKYGKSFMVLSEKFKTNAIYFAGDTFFASDEAMNMAKKLPAGSLASVSAEHQVSFRLLAALYAFAGPKLRQELIASCLKDLLLKDTEDAELLVEAHLFEPLLFRGGLERVSIVLEKADGTPMEKSQRQAVQANAEAFCKGRGIKLKIFK